MTQVWMKIAQNRQKSYADMRRRDLEFEVGDLVYLKILLKKGVKRFGKKGKPSPRYISPYKILSYFGKVAYELKFPISLASVNPVVYVFLLMKCIGNSTKVIPLEDMDIKGSLSYESILVEILDRQIHRLRNKEVPLVKVLWWELLGKQKKICKPSTITFSPQTQI